MEQFKEFNATLLYCPNCKEAVSVNEKLLLILPNGSLYEYKCKYCGKSLGDKRDTSAKPNRDFFK